MTVDFSVVGGLALVMGGFGLFVRLTIKGAIGDLKDELAKSYLPATDVQARLAAIYQRLDKLEMRYAR